ncbi:hypothetical protein KKI24_27720 [bacterium]|nr:hypothetical protein [bacterium]
MGKFRKKPVVIEAHQWNKQKDHGQVEPWMHDPNLQPQMINGEVNAKCKQCGHKMKDHGRVSTLEGWHIVCPGDWIIKGVKGEFYPCKPDIFEQTYEEVDDPFGPVNLNNEP